MDINIEVTSGVNVTDVPEDVAKDLQDAYDALSALPVNRQATVDFTDGKDDAENAKAARLFCRQAKAWAAAQEITVVEGDGKTRTTCLTFARKGNVKDNPTRVSFRIYIPRPTEDSEE